MAMPTAPILQATFAGESLSMTYNGSISHSDNYQAARTSSLQGRLRSIAAGWPANEVGSSRYESQNHALGFALRQKTIWSN